MPLHWPCGVRVYAFFLSSWIGSIIASFHDLKSKSTHLWTKDQTKRGTSSAALSSKFSKSYSDVNKDAASITVLALRRQWRKNNHNWRCMAFLVPSEMHRKSLIWEDVKQLRGGLSENRVHWRTRSYSGWRFWCLCGQGCIEKTNTFLSVWGEQFGSSASLPPLY